MNTTETESRSPSRQALAALAAMGSVYFFSYFLRAAVPGTIFDDLQAELGISAAAVAAMGSMFTWIYGGMQIVVGVLADRYGGGRTLVWGGGIMLVGAVLFPLSHAVWLAFAARVITGLGASFMYLSLIKELDRLFGHRQFTVWLGVILAVGYSGGVVATLPFERAAAAFGWRPSLLAVAILLACSLCAAAYALRRLGGGPRQPVRAARFAEVLGNRACRPLLACSLITFPVVFVMQTVLGKKFLQDFGGLSSSAAAECVLAMTATSVCCVALGGGLPRFFDERRRPLILGGAALFALAVGTLLTATLAGAPGWVFPIGYILMSASGVALPSSTSVMKELNRPDSVAMGISVMNGLAYIGCGTIGQAGGLILDRFRDTAHVAASGAVVYPQAAYVALFTFMAVLAALNVLAAWHVPETRGVQRGDPLAAEEKQFQTGVGSCRTSSASRGPARRARSAGPEDMTRLPMAERRTRTPCN